MNSTPIHLAQASLLNLQTTHIQLPARWLLSSRWPADPSAPVYPKSNSSPHPALRPCLQSCLTSSVLCLSGWYYSPLSCF